MAKTEVSKQQAVAMSAQLLRQFHETLDETSRTAGLKMMRALVDFFGNASPEEVQAATDRKLVGAVPKSTDAVRLSQTRSAYAVFRHLGPEAFALEILESGHGGWTDLMGVVRGIRADIKAERADEKIVEEANKAAEVLAKGDPAKQVEIAAAYREAKREAIAVQAAEAKLERESVAGVAKRIARRLIDDKGVEFAREVAEALAAAVEAAVAEAEKEAAEA